MIGYRIDYQSLRVLITAENSSWLSRADLRTAGFRASGKYEENSSIWSEVKSVYMRLQGKSKCIYCERSMESEHYGLIEQDVEHFRPKGKVSPWKLPADLAAEGIKITDPGSAAPGYHELPYHLFNYSASCKPCNSTLKSDYFPISGVYNFSGNDPSLLLSELPLLIYPLGDFDSSPEDLIKFHGLSPQPVNAAGHKRHRALVTIAFFQLADTKLRQNLFRERAFIVAALHPQLEVLKNNPKDNAANILVKAYQSENSPHANCARSFVKLHSSDPAEALKIFEAAVIYIEKSS